MVDDVGTTAYVYDDFYRLITVTNPITGSVGYRYDDAGNRTQLIYPDGREVGYTYDGDNRLSQVDDWNNGVTTYQYDGAGRLITTTLPNGVVSLNAYDDANRLLSLRHEGGDGSLLAEYAYQLDGVGNRVAVTETILQPGSPYMLGWTVASTQTSSYLGYWSPWSAGDVNNDGYDDVVVGALFYDNGETDEGRAWLYPGGSAGLSITTTWTYEINEADANLGHQVATAGDVNGDGYDDLVIGARKAPDGVNQVGKAFVFHGSSSSLGTTPDWTATGDQSAGNFGYAVATAGDINGDGYDDVIVGAPYYDNGDTDEGRAYLYLGSSAGLSTTASWVVESDQASAVLGLHVGTVGDVNGDGYDDVYVNAYLYDNGETDEGRLYIYYGSASGLSTAPDWIGEGNQVNAQYGIAAAGVGDVNGDGYDDVLVGAQEYDNGETNEGRVYLYYGSVSGLSTAAAWTSESNQAGAAYGWAVNPAGDINDDGYDDFFIGADEYDSDYSSAGRIFLFYGAENGPADAPAWTYDGTGENGRFGSSVVTGGDINGDGRLDFLVGEPYYNSQSGRGHAFYTEPPLQATTVTYQYDNLYRLTGVAYAGDISATYDYDYDPVGNMTAFTETVDAQTTSAARSFDAANRLQTSTDAAAGTTSYVYDDNGNLTTVYPPGADAGNPVGALQYAYDQRNLLLSHETNPDGTAWVLQAEYVYDGSSNRLQQVDYTGATPITTTYTNDIVGLTQVLVADDGTSQVMNLFGLDLISQDSGSEVRTLLADGLGSVRTEMVGGVVETATTYSPYGEVLAQAGTSGTVYGFTGEQEDGATGLLYLRARYYNSYLNRFLSADTIVPDFRNPQNLNLHVYVNNNPVNWVDPSGHVVECVPSGFCGGESELPAPRIVKLATAIHVIVMPAGLTPPPINEDFAKLFGYVNAAVDVGEAGSAGAVLIGSPAAAPLQYGLSFADIAVAAAGSYFAGETGKVDLHPSLPPIWLIGQDPIITTAEAILVPCAQAGLIAAGASTGSVAGSVGGYVAAQGLDITTSLATAVYDVGRAEGRVPTKFATGFYWDSSVPTRIPLPLVPQGQPVLAFVLYE